MMVPSKVTAVLPRKVKVELDSDPHAHSEVTWVVVTFQNMFGRGTRLDLTIEEAGDLYDRLRELRGD